LSSIAAPKPFLEAEWRYLAMLNYAVEPSLLAPFVPEGTELDFLEGRTFVSVVGFLFLNTRVLGEAVPLHRDFEEVNLRFYVRRKSADTWRRGVVFVRELVPRVAIAAAARIFYGEPYTNMPMRHAITDNGTGVSVEYGWRRGRKWEELKMVAAAGPPQGRRNRFLPVRTKSLSLSITGVTPLAGTRVNTAWNIRAGASGRRSLQISRPMSPRFMASGL
jgi:uncharacterized protein YqjF (DUF2071 family)